MRKIKTLLLALLAMGLLLYAGCALAAETDPVVCSIELDPAKLSGPGTVNVTITIANSGSTDMKDPITLYDPTTKVVEDFGTNGSVTLKAGESQTWKGTYDVNQSTLTNGAVVYYAQYTLYKDSGEAVKQSQSIRGTISAQSAEADIEVRRTITPTAAREGQEITVRYEIENTGTVPLTNVTIQEHKDVHSKKQTIGELKPGNIAEVKYPVKMGKKDLTSGATITYKSETSKKTQTYTVENFKIINGESSLEATLASSSKGVPANEKITLTLTLKNKGSVGVSDLRVNDPKLGEVFSNQEIAAGKTLKLEKEITLPETTEYVFTVTAMDTTGTEVTTTTEPVEVVTVDPSEVLTLDVSATPDKTEVYESPGMVRFTININNPSNVAAKNVSVSHGETTLYTFETIPAGESRKLTRDTALSQAGKYRFTVSAQDPLENNLTFASNEMQIVFSVPTPAPATATPPPVPTSEPTVPVVTMPPITDGSIGAVPKAIQSVLLPILILAGLLLIGSIVLLAIATKRRAEQRKAAEAALDHLERAKRRDYITPAEEKEPEEEPDSEPSTFAVEDEGLSDFDLPPISAVREAKRDTDYPSYADGLYDEEMTSDLNQYAQPEADEPYESDGYTDGYQQDDYVADDYAATDDTGYVDDGLGYADPTAYADDYVSEEADDLYGTDGQYVDGHLPDDRDGFAPAEDDPHAEGGRSTRRSRAERGSDAPAEL